MARVAVRYVPSCIVRAQVGRKLAQLDDPVRVPPPKSCSHRHGVRYRFVSGIRWPGASLQQRQTLGVPSGQSIGTLRLLCMRGSFPKTTRLRVGGARTDSPGVDSSTAHRRPLSPTEARYPSPRPGVTSGRSVLERPECPREGPLSDHAPGCLEGVSSWRSWSAVGTCFGALSTVASATGCDPRWLLTYCENPVDQTPLR